MDFPPMYFAPAISALTENKRTEQVKDDGLPVDIKLPVKHILSRELQMYFDKIAELTMSRSSTPIFREALVSLSKDSGLHPLVPYFSYFIADEVTRSLADLPVLFALMRVVQSLLRNPHIHIEPYGNILNRKSERTTRKLLTTVTGAKGDESEFDSVNAPLEPQTWEGSFLCGCAL